MADLLSGARIALAALMLACGLAAAAPWAAAALLAGGVTDVVDGRLARARGGSAAGPQLDAVADVTLLVSAAATLQVVQPAIAEDNALWLAAVFALWVASLALTWVSSGRLVDPKQRTGKLAGGVLYLFALATLLLGGYSAVLLAAALGALAVASADAIRRAVTTIHAKGTASAARSRAG